MKNILIRIRVEGTRHVITDDIMEFRDADIEDFDKWKEELILWVDPVDIISSVTTEKDNGQKFLHVNYCTWEGIPVLNAQEVCESLY